MSFHRCVLICLCCVLIIQFVSSLAYYTAITSQLHEVVLLYPGQARSERDLDICTEGGICSIVHQRLWFPHQAERFCRCQNDEECPWTWEKHDDNRTLFLNNLSQMKTCKRTNEMPICKAEQTALMVDETITEALKERNVQATALCTCKSPAYWALQKHFHRVHPNGTTQTSSHYHCAKLTKCKEEEHCGNVRRDYYSTYQHCSCPKGHLCLIGEKSATNVTELLFNGPAYRAYCSPFKTTHSTILNDKLSLSDNTSLITNQVHK